MENVATIQYFNPPVHNGIVSQLLHWCTAGPDKNMLPFLLSYTDLLTSFPGVYACCYLIFRILYNIWTSEWAYGKAGNGNEMETGNWNWKLKLETVSSNLIFTGNTTFLANSAFVYGAAGIYIVNCNLSSSGIIHFMSNTNSYSISQENEPFCVPENSLNFTETTNFANGFSLWWCNQCNKLITYTTSYFSDNSAMMGGAICTSGSVLIFTETSTFSRNMAGYIGGGAIIAFGTTLMFKGNIRFTNNYSPLWEVQCFWLIVHVPFCLTQLYTGKTIMQL